MKYKVLDEPLTKDAMDKDGWVKGVVAVDIGDIATGNYELFLDLLSERLVGNELLMDIQYRVVGHSADVLHIEVTGDASEVFEQVDYHD